MAEQPRPLGFWLVLVDRLISEQFLTALDEHGVTRRQWQLLSVLDERSAALSELDEAVRPFLQAEGESSADHLTELLESGWVAAEGDRYSLTERGRGAFERLREIVEASRQRASEGVSRADYETTVEVLERMARNLGWPGE